MIEILDFITGRQGFWLMVTVIGITILRRRQKSKGVVWEQFACQVNTVGWMYRARVPWGWMVKQVDDVLHDSKGTGSLEEGLEWRSSITFVFDPLHLWQV